MDSEDKLIHRDEEISQLARQIGYTVLVWSAVVAAVAVTAGVICLVYYAVPALKSARHASDATVQVYEQGLPQIKEGAQKSVALLDNLDRMTNEAAAATARLNHAAGVVDSQTPAITSNILNMEQRLDAQLLGPDGTIERLRKIEGTVNDQVAANGDLVQADLREINKSLQSFNGYLTGPEVTKLVASLADSGANLDAAAYRLKVLVEDPQLAESIKHSAANLEVVTEQTGRITRNLADITGSVADRVVPGRVPPPHGFRAKLGHYALKVLGFAKDAGGVTFLIVKIMNGIQ